MSGFPMQNVFGVNGLSCETEMSDRSASGKNAGCSIWTVYRYPNDYPGYWVMRAHEVLPGVGIRPHSFCIVARTLNEIRAKVPPGTWRVGREPNDNSVIYETWIAETATPSRQ
jgi:hypothetical protein